MTVFHVPVPKSKGTVSIDSDRVHEDCYGPVFAAGLKAVINSGPMLKVLKPKDETDEKAMSEYHAAAMATAQERVEQLITGKLKFGRASASGADAKTMTEARRIAKQLVKDTLRANGQKVSHYSTADILAAANAVIASDPTILKMAEENLSKRSAAVVNIAASLKEDPEATAKAKAKAATKTKPEKMSPGAILSATQAGKVAPRAHH